MTGRRDVEPLPCPLKAPSASQPPESWEELRQGCPVARVSLPSGDEATLLARYQDVRTARSDPRLSHVGLLTAPLRELPVTW